jgi:hypothetical protein
VPVGLFGVHATPLTPARAADWGIEAVRLIEHTPTGRPATSPVPMVVECFFDRYQPALVLTDRDWRRRLETLGAEYGRQAGTGAVRHVEFWNEPYLNWAGNPGVNYDGAFYEPADVHTGGVMTVRGWDRPLTNLVWAGPRLVALPATGGPVNYVATRYLPAGVREGEVFEWRGRAYRAAARWWGRDLTQPAPWWSGEVNREFYHMMLLPFAQALKRANPRVRLIAGWGFHLNQDDWAAWRLLHRPLIDAAWPWIDGLNEHHYGGDTANVALTYEVAWTYALTRYGKRLSFFNTEAGGGLDPERPERAVARPERDSLGAFAYTVRDLVHLLDVCPDKAATRFAHEADANGGDEVAFRLLKPLRGCLVECRSPHPDLWCVAALQGARLCAVVFNDGAATSFPFRAAAPAGTRFTSGRRTDVVRRDGRLALHETALGASGEVSETTVDLAARSAVRFLFYLDHPAPASERADVRTVQYPAAGILQTVAPGETARFAVDVPAAGGPARPVEMRLRYAIDAGTVPVERVACSVDGVSVPLSSQRRRVCEIGLGPRPAAGSHTIAFSLPADVAAGIRVNCVSLLVCER